MAGKSLLPTVEPFDWPSAHEIAEAQRALDHQLRAVLRQVESNEPDTQLWLDSNDKIVLSVGAERLKARICAIAHQGRHGHLPHEVSATLIEKYFWWAGLKQDVKRWMHCCLQCIKLKGGKLMPRPMGHMLTAQQPFEVIAMDFLDMPATARKNGFKHVPHPQRQEIEKGNTTSVQCGRHGPGCTGGAGEQAVQDLDRASRSYVGDQSVRIRGEAVCS